jgi:hypothetical protein
MKSSCVLAACILGAAADHRVYYSDGDASSFGSVLVNTTVPPKNVSRTHKYNLLDLAYKTADWVCGGYDNVNVWNLGNTKDSNGGFWDNGRTECDKGSNSWHGSGVKCMERFMEVEKVEYSEYVIEQQMAPVHLQVLVNGSNGAQSGSHQWSESEANAYEWNWSETLEIGISTEVSVGIPEVCGGKETFSTTISQSTGGSESREQQKTYTLTQDFNVPAGSCETLYMDIPKASYTVDYWETLKIQGRRTE